jgi:hypothetical protein
MRPSPSINPALLGTGKLTSLPQLERGRGARSNPTHRFAEYAESFFDDGWDSLADVPPLKTEIFTETPKSIITRNESPDISFDRSINPYRGCEHGCVYTPGPRILTWACRRGWILNRNFLSSRTRRLCFGRN